MSDEPRKPDGTEPATPVEQSGVPVDQVSTLVSDFQATLKEMRTQPPAVAPAPAGPSKEELLVQYEAAKQKANEMAAGGEYADALEHMYQTWTSMNAGNQQTLDQNPAFKGLKATAKRAATSDHKDMFEKYGEEIAQVVDARAPEDQINPDVWDAAVREVKSAHVDEIMDEQFEARMAALETGAGSSPAARVAGGSRGRAPDATPDEVELTADEEAFAAQINFTPERYAKAKASYQKHSKGPGSVDLMDETPGTNIKPGSF